MDLETLQHYSTMVGKGSGSHLATPFPVAMSCPGHHQLSVVDMCEYWSLLCVIQEMTLKKMTHRNHTTYLIFSDQHVDSNNFVDSRSETYNLSISKINNYTYDLLNILFAYKKSLKIEKNSDTNPLKFIFSVTIIPSF